MSFETVSKQEKPYTLDLLPGAEQEIPAGFIDGAFEFALEHGTKLKHTNVSEKGVPTNEIIWKFPGKDGKAFVAKLVQPDKMATPDQELRILQRIHESGLPAPRPLGMLRVGSADFTLMEYVDGVSGQDIWLKLVDQGWTDEQIALAKTDAERMMTEIADRFRNELEIDKPWYIKDFLLKFEGRTLVSMFPLDWERAHPYDPKKPDKIRSSPPARV
jgi:hypothetical protein